MLLGALHPHRHPVGEIGIAARALGHALDPVHAVLDRIGPRTSDLPLDPHEGSLPPVGFRGHVEPVALHERDIIGPARGHDGRAQPHRDRLAGSVRLESYERRVVDRRRRQETPGQRDKSAQPISLDEIEAPAVGHRSLNLD